MKKGAGKLIRCDKTLSELWHLRGSNDEEASETAFMAINAIKRLQEENERFEKALKAIAYPKVEVFLSWQEEQESEGNDLNEWDWFSSIAKNALNKE